MIPTQNAGYRGTERKHLIQFGGSRKASWRKRPPAQRRKSWTGKKKRRGNNGADSKDQHEEKRGGVRAQHAEDLQSSQEVCILGQMERA